MRKLVIFQILRKGKQFDLLGYIFCLGTKVQIFLGLKYHNMREIFNLVKKVHIQTVCNLLSVKFFRCEEYNQNCDLEPLSIQL